MSNVTTLKVTIPVDCPIGYRPVAVRVPQVGECYVIANGVCMQHETEVATTARYLIVEPEPTWKPPDWFPRGVCVLLNGTWWVQRGFDVPAVCSHLASVFGKEFVPPSTGTRWEIDADGKATMVR